jgi:hypothetical protein
MPLIIDESLSIDNSYLEGLAYLNNNNAYSLKSIYEGRNNYLYYTTCLEPHGDKAFVYVNIDTLKITKNLYHNLLSVWTQQSLSDIQKKILDNLTPVRRNLSKLFQNINKSTNLEEIQQQINNIQSTAQNPVINTMVETWPRYMPPYDIILNVPSKSISSKIKETFTDYNNDGIEDDLLFTTTQGDFTLDYVRLNSSNLSNVSSNVYIRADTNKKKCVPLDLDDAIDESGNIRFDASGNITLGEVDKRRKNLRDKYAANTQDTSTYYKIIGGVFGVILALALAYAIIKYGMYRNAVGAIAAGPPGALAQPTIPLPSNLFTNVSMIGVSLIFLMCGFFIGAIATKSV